MKKPIEADGITKPKPQKKDNRIGSKTAPIETDTDFNFDVDNNEEYISTYNYYIYYNSIKPRDPRLPKPTYKPMPDIDYIKEGIKEKEIKENDEEFNDINIGKNIHQFLGEDEKLDKMMNNLNLKDNSNSPQNNQGIIPEEDYDIRKNNNLDDNKNLNNFNLNFGNQNQYNIKNNDMAPTPMDLYNGMQNQNNQINYQNMMNNPFGYGMINNNNDINNFYGGNNNNINNQMNNNDIDNNINNPNYSNIKNNNMNMNEMYQNSPFMNMNDVYPNFKNMYANNMMNMGMNNIPMNNMNVQNMQMFNVYMNKFQNPNNIYSNQNIYQRQGGKFPNNNNYNMNYMGMNMGMMNNNNNSLMKRTQINETATFEDVYSSIPEICKSHSGSRIFQKVFDEGTEEQKQKIIDKLKPEVYFLSKDVFGNYVIQRLLESVSPQNKKVLISQLYNKIKELTLHMYGCRVIQKAIDLGDIDDIRKHLEELQGDLIKCVQDQNGNHVIQKLIEKLPKGEHGPIVNAIKGRVYQLSIHQYGCRVIQRIFEYCTDEEKDIVLKETYERINELCLDQYGNYVIQNIIEKIKDNEKIYDGIQGKIFDYSIHKFASNVVEKCLSLGNKFQTQRIVNEIIEQDNKTNNALLTLVKDKYGNYVIQKMIEVADMESKEILVKRITSSQILKKRDGFSKHVMGMIEKSGFSSLLEQNNNNQGNNVMNNMNVTKGKFN